MRPAPGATTATPVPAGSPRSGEHAAADRIHDGTPDVLGADREHHAGQCVMVLGSGDTALGVLIDLARSRRPGPRYHARLGGAK